MGSELQQIVEQMSSGGFYPHPVGKIVHLETHISHLFLAGDFVYKVKKPVDLGFLDFTDFEKRRHYCEEEVRLNRRLTSGVYLDVREIKHDGERYALNGRGETAECAVVMKRLPEEAALNNILSENRLDEKFVEDLARSLVRFYEEAETSEAIDEFGSVQMIQKNCRENFAQLEDHAGKRIDAEIFRFIRSASEAFIHRNRDLFRRRISEKKIRDCHGDLRTEHVYHFEGVQIIDCIEFNHRFRFQDIAADLAFLVMDIDFRGRLGVALRLLRKYVHETGDRDLMTLIDFYKCYRAMVRLKVNCLQMADMENQKNKKPALEAETKRYLELGYRYAVKMMRPVVRAVCGMIASGKSAIAKELSDTFAVRCVRSDVIRKSLFDIPSRQTADAEFGQGLYSEEVTALVYARMLREAQEEVENGRSVVLDATFASRRFRKQALTFAEDAKAFLIFIECACSEDEIKTRLRKRESAPGVSDARLKHYEDMRDAFEPVVEVPSDRHIAVNTEISLQESIEIILAREQNLLARQAEALIR